MTKQQDFSMWSVNFILFCLANFLYYGAFYLYIPVLPQYVEMLGYADMFALSGIIVLVITLAFWLLVQQRHTIKLEGE